MEALSEVDRYIAERLVRDDAVTRTDGLPPHEVTAPQGALLELLAAADQVELIVGPALETLPTLDGPFDLVFIDADKRANADYLRHALRLSRPGTLIVADNVIRGGAVGSKGYDGFALVLVG
jgi:predicted O-methyltransferase YrrM